LLQKPVEAECQLFLGGPAPGFALTDKSGAGGVLLQIIEEWVVQRPPDGGKIVSAFKCDYEIQFEILRKMSQVLLLPP
jgi:hypothetical protein